MNTRDMTSLPGSTSTKLPIDDGEGCESYSLREVSYDLPFLDIVANNIIQNTSTPSETLPRLLSSKNWLIRAVEESLTRRQFKMFELHYIYGYNQETISRICGCTQPGVSKVLSQATQRLRRKLGPVLSPLLVLREFETNAGPE